MLVLISPGFANGEADSTCLPAIQQMVLSFKDKLGAENICIIALHYPFQKSEYTWHGIKVYALAGKNKKSPLRLFIWISFFALLFKINRQSKIKALLTFWMNEGALLSKLYSQLTGVPLAFWVQGQDARKTNKYVRFLRPMPNQVFSISDFSAAELKNNFGLFPTTVAANGIRPASFPPLNRADRPISVIGVGSLTSLKNYKLFVEVLAELSKKLPNLHFLHCGEGPELQSLAQLSKELHIDSNLKFVGNTPHTKVFDLLNQSKVLLHTSQYEGSSTVTAEALYLGCKVVSTFSLGNEPVKGLYVTTNKNEMLQLLFELLSNPTPAESVASHFLSDSIDIICTRLKLQ